MEERRLPAMRAGDVDRERVLEVVRQAHAEGRLDVAEFYQRLDAVYQAKTFAELDHLVVDLPVGATMPTASLTPATRPPVSAPPVASPEAGPLARLPPKLRALWVTWATVVSINLLIWVIVAVTGAFSENVEIPYFWPIWVAGPWGVVLAGMTLGWRLNRPRGDDPPALPPVSA